MLVTRLTQLEPEVITLEEAKAHMRIDHSDDDAKIAAFILAALAYISERTGRTMGPIDFRASVANWFSRLRLPYHPVRAVESVAYVGTDGLEVTIGPSNWSWVRDEGCAYVHLKPSFSQPALADREEVELRPVRVYFSAGYDLASATGSGEDPELACPDNLRQAALMLVAHYYEMREAAGEELKVVPFGVEAILVQMRVYR